MKYIIIGFIIFVLCFCLLLEHASAQNKLVFLRHIDQKHDWFEIDPLGNLYFIDKHVLIKLDTDGKQKNFSDDFHTYISQVDVSDPLNILVYYANDNRIVFLDNNLATRDNRFFLDQLEIEEPTQVAKSSTALAWVFDPFYASLLCIDANGKVQLESKDLTHLSNGRSEPNYLAENGKYLVVNVPSSGILVFDYQAAFLQHLVYPHIKPHDIQLAGNKLYLKVGRQLIILNLMDGSQKQLALPSSCLQTRVYNSAIYCADNTGLNVYQTKNNDKNDDK